MKDDFEASRGTSVCVFLLRVVQFAFVCFAVLVPSNKQRAVTVAATELFSQAVLGSISITAFSSVSGVEFVAVSPLAIQLLKTTDLLQRVA